MRRDFRCVDVDLSFEEEQRSVNELWFARAVLVDLLFNRSTILLNGMRELVDVERGLWVDRFPLLLLLLLLLRKSSKNGKESN